MSEFALRFLLANLAVGAAVLVVLALRAPVRAMFGARLTYAMWLLVPLAGLASLLPPRVEQIVNFVRPAPELRGEWQGPVPWEPMLEMPGQDGPAPEMPSLASPQFAGTASITRESSGFEMPNPGVPAMIVWLAGVIGMVAWQLRRQARFVSDAKAGFAGPAVVGVIHPRIVTPSDFETTFDPSEREMILAHERIHIEGNDARINALAALAGCICWFNPLVHLGAYFMRIDQELACDASVVSRHPEAKSLYASALLKAQLARAPLPLGCHWPSRSEHPLLQRVEMLGRAEPGRGRRIAGVALLGLLAAASGVAAWAAMPPDRRVVERQMIDRQDAPAHQDAPAPPDASGKLDPNLRIEALRRSMLEVRLADGTKMVHRYFEPGESYMPRVGAGWTVSAEDGAAFEWRSGDKSLGLLAPSGEAKAIPVDSMTTHLQPIKLQAAPQGAIPANQEQVRYSTFVVSADKASVETGRSIYEGNVSIRFVAGQNADAIMRVGDFAIIQYPQTRGLALQDVNTDGPLRVTAARNFSDLPTNTVSWEGRVEVRLGDIMIAADQVSFQTSPSDKTMLRSIRFEQRTEPSGGVLFGVNRLEIEGNKRVTTETILALMDQKPGAFDGVRIDESMAGLRASGLFRNFNVLIRGNNKSTVVLGLEENDPVPGGETEALRGLRMKAAAAARKFAGVARRYDERHPEYEITFAQQQEAEKQLNAEINRAAQQPPKLPTGFDANDPVYLRGTVEKIDFSDTTYTAYIRARSIAAGPVAPAKTDDHLWKLSPINYWGDRDRVSKDILRELVNVTGYRSTNKSCGAECQMHVSTMIKCSVQATFAPGCAPEPGQQALYQQQPPPPPLPPLPPKPALPAKQLGNLVIPPEYDPQGWLTVRGKVERIDFGDTKYTVLVRASSVSLPNSDTLRADTALFELTPVNYWGDRDAVTRDLKDKAIAVTGLRGVSKDCRPACKLMTIGPMKMVRPTALPAIATAPDFGAADVVMRYDPDTRSMVEGVVQRIEFGERAFDAYVQAPAFAGVPGPVFQVRSEYRLPRGDIEKQLSGKTIFVAGWPSKAPGDVVCGSLCGIYATDIRLAGGEVVTPAGARLINPAQPDHPPRPGDCFRTGGQGPSSDLNCVLDNRGLPTVDTRRLHKDDRFDLDAPVTIDGRIISADAQGWMVEVVGFEPASTPGSAPGARWFVESIYKTDGYLGRRITISGYNAKDKSCQPTCRMVGVEGMWIH